MRTKPACRSRVGQIIAPKIGANGYATHNLVGADGRQHTVSTHRLVWDAFNGPVPPGMVVNHRDGDKTNPALSNLELVTRSASTQHALRLGLTPHGERSHAAKLRDADALEIYENPRRESGAEPADRFKVTQTTISRIRRGLSWSRVTQARPD